MSDQVIEYGRRGDDASVAATGREDARLAALGAYGLTRDSDATFDRIARLAADRLGCPAAFVSIVDAERQWTKAAYGAPVYSQPREQSFCARVVARGELVVIDDPASDPDWADLAVFPENAAMRFYAAAPLVSPEGFVLGVLSVTDSQPHAFGEAERQALRDLAAIAMDAMQLRDALRQADGVQMRLAQSEARHRAILETAADAIITIGKDGIIQTANPAAERLFGYRTTEMVGRNVSMLMPEPHVSQHDGYIRRYLKEGGPRIIGIGREVPGRRADGSTFPAELAVSESVVAGNHVFTGILRDLSERKRTEERLRESIELVRLAEQTARLGHWRLDLKSETFFWSEEVYAIHGVDPAAFTLTLETAIDFFDPADRTAVQEALADAIRDGQGFALEGEILRPDGARRMVHTVGRSQLDGAGNAIALVGTFQDVTERRLIQQELERSRERLERSTTYTNIGIWEWDIPSGDLWWSDRIAPLFGLGDGAMTTSYEAFMEAIHPEDRAAVQEAVRAAVEDGAPYEMEHRVVWPDGSVRWMQERGAVERDAEGNPWRMLGAVQDVTRAKEAELALKETGSLLAMSIDNISDGFVLFDDQDRIVLWNERWLEIFPRLRPHVRVGRSFAEVIRAGAEDGQFPHAVGRVDAWMEERLKHHGEAEELHEQLLEGGRWVRVAERRMENGWRVGIRTDITEIRRAQEEAQTANRAKSDFLSKMSHELRTPLNAILGFAQLLQVSRKDPLSDTQARHVGHILEGGRHLLELINEILDLARIEAGRLPLCLGDMDPAPVIKDCLGMAQTLAVAMDVDVSMDVPEHLPAVHADSKRLRQVLLNLLSNAVKYNHRGGSVLLQAVVTGGVLRLTVRDTGPGLAPELQDSIFEPFNRAGAEGSAVEGAGIGLTITRQLVELMHGAIGVGSMPGEGAAFWVDIPLAETGGVADDRA